MSDRVLVAVIIAIAVLSTGLVVGAVLLAVLAPNSSANTLITLTGFLVPTIASLLALLRAHTGAQQAMQKLDQAHRENVDKLAKLDSIQRTNEEQTGKIEEVKVLVNGERHALLARITELEKKLVEKGTS